MVAELLNFFYIAWVAQSVEDRCSRLRFCEAIARQSANANHQLDIAQIVIGRISASADAFRGHQIIALSTFLLFGASSHSGGVSLSADVKSAFNRRMSEARQVGRTAANCLLLFAQLREQDFRFPFLSARRVAINQIDQFGQI